MSTRVHGPATALAAALVGLALAAPAAAATLKVGRGKPYATIGEAVAAAGEGDTIVVYGGRYTETVEITTPGLVLRAKQRVTWLPAVWRGRCLTLAPGADGAEVSGFRFSTHGDALTVQAPGVRVVKCRFRGGDGISGAGGDDLVVSRCDLRSGGRAVDVDASGVTLERTRIAHHDSGPVEIVGDDTVVDRVLLSGSTDDSGFELRGDRVRVERCRTRSTWNHGIVVRGDDCVVRRNVVEGLINDPGIEVDGDRALVEDNVVSGSLRYPGIDVDGQAFTVRGNRVLDSADSFPAIVAGNGAGTGGQAVLADNVVVGSGMHGIEVFGQGVLVTGNRVEDCARTGFMVFGAGHRLERNVVVGAGEHGFRVDAAGVTLVDCVALECETDGFRIVASATGVVLDGCRASGAAACGLHNSGTAAFTGCTFTGCRVDVADDGTLTDGGGNTFTTGGTDSPPVD